MYYPGLLHKISLQSVHNFLSNVVHRQTYKQTNQRYEKHNLLCQQGNEMQGMTATPYVLALYKEMQKKRCQ